MTASALVAYVVREPALGLTVLGTMLCVFSLCLGAATLNNYQDRHVDAKLRRTRERALPLGEISSRAALVQAALLILSGTVGLFFVGESLALERKGTYDDILNERIGGASHTTLMQMIDELT